MQEAIVKTVVLRNVGHTPYNGDDKLLRNVSLRIAPGQQATLSREKALQLIRDFPSCWQLVPGGDKEAEKDVTEAITLGVVRTASLSPTVSGAAPRAGVVAPVASSAPTAQQTFIRAALENKCQVETLKQTDPGFMRVVAGNGFVGAQTYAVKVPLLTGEFGANMKKMVRYVLEVKPAGEEAPAKASPATGVETFAAPAPPGRDLEPEALGAHGGGDDDDLDDDDKHPAPGRKKPSARPARRTRDEDEDDDD